MIAWFEFLRPSRLVALAALAVTWAAGCTAPLQMPDYLSGSRRAEAELNSRNKQTATDLVDPHDPKATALRKAAGGTPPAEDEALAGILAELRKIEALDPKVEAQLLADLKNAKPEYYPLIVEQFRAALAYRRQLDERNRSLAEHPAADPAAVATVSRTQPAAEEAAAAVPHNEPSTSQFSQKNSSKSKLTQTRKPAADPAVRVLPTPRPEQEGLAASTVQLAARPAAVAIASDGASKETPLEVQPVSYIADPPKPVRHQAAWTVDLEKVIHELESSVASQPATVEELHDHMRLRALKLLAGRDEEAYQPIPGASAALQDYWSKQLFAINAFLDASPKLDDKQRAAATLVHLDQARTRLSELATLQIRNLAYVESVGGFGAYTPLKDAKFRPGQKVTVYAEVENCRATADKQGYHTSLGTSYQVLDQAGQRVEGAEFPDVIDECRNHRRDFYMQYDLTLPTQIYPGTYRLQFTITDNNSNKIGVATLPFEIAGQGQ